MMGTIPGWLHMLSIAWLALGFACAAYLALDVLRRPQPMWIMNIVWPVTALFGTVLVVWQYLAYGRASHHDGAMKMPESARQSHTEKMAERAATPAMVPGMSGMSGAMDMSGGPETMAMAGHHGAMKMGGKATPFAAKVANGTLHCGSGCTLGDILAEWLVFLVPAIAVWFGYGTVFGEKIFAVWVVDFIFAFGFGVVFQYFTIAPMRGLAFGPGIRAAVKADTFSLIAWQVGMYGFMGFAYFYVFGNLLGVRLTTNTPEFWFMMQIAMMCGFVTAYPVNWWLIRAGIKEAM